jgi:hypothetical protein
MYKYADNIYCVRIEFGFEIYTTTTQSPVQNPVYYWYIIGITPRWNIEIMKDILTLNSCDKYLSESFSVMLFQEHILKLYYAPAKWRKVSKHVSSFSLHASMPMSVTGWTWDT